MESTQLNEQLVCLSRVHGRAAAYVASVLGMNLANFHAYIQNPKSADKLAAAKSTRRKEALKLPASMVERLCELHKFSTNGFSEPMLDSWLIRSHEDWERLNKCFKITPLLAIDSTETIKRNGLTPSKIIHGLQLYEPLAPDQDRYEQRNGHTEKLDREQGDKKNANTLYQFMLAQVTAGKNWRAVLIRMTGSKLQELYPDFWNSRYSDRTVFHLQRRQNLFHLHEMLIDHRVPLVDEDDPTDSAVHDFIRKVCYPIIKERLEGRFDAEEQKDQISGRKKIVLLDRPARLKRYAKLIRSMLKLTPDRMNHLGATATLANTRCEVEVGCIFEETSSLLFRATVKRKEGSPVWEHIVVLREHKGGFIEIAYCGPRDYLFTHATHASSPSDQDTKGLLTERVLHDMEIGQGIEWYEISLPALREVYKSVPIDRSLLLEQRVQ